MTATAGVRTPGLYFETLAPEPRDVLPRMDVAAFVGFAASGPLDVPVPVEDPAEFEDIFGRDLTIGAAGQRLHTQLAPAVRAFFRNGGRRCWVVRVARRPAANTFVLPGIVDVRPTPQGMTWSPATARARSEGIWSRSIAVNTTLMVTPLAPGAVEWRAETRSFLVTLDTGRSAIRPGELLRVHGDVPGLSAFVAIPEDPAADGTGRVEVPADAAFWVEEADAEPWPFDRADIAVAARHVLPEGVREPVQILQATRTDGTLRLAVVNAGRRPLRAGSWIEIDVSTATPAGGQWLLQVERTHPAVPSGSPAPSAGAVLEFESGRAWRLSTAPISSPPFAVKEVNALTFELWTRDEKSRSLRLADLGFARGHSRYWGRLPTDTDLFLAPELALVDQRTLARDVLHPRFPLAGSAREDDRAPAACLPLGVPALLRGELEEHAEPPLASDGLDHITADLFLDPALRDASVENLLEHAFRVRNADRASQRLLHGVHALTYIDEISLIAAPDALLSSLPGLHKPPAPHGVTLAARATATDVTLEWPAVRDNAVSYTLQQSETADFAMPSLSERLVPGTSTVLVTTDGVNTRRLDRLRGTCAPNRWYRVRVEGPGGGGPWSNTVRILPEATSFEPEAQLAADAPVLTATRASEQLTLSWTHTGAARYRLESSVEPTFAAAYPLFEGTGVAFSMRTQFDTGFFRVRAQTEPPGAWSNSVRVGPEADVAVSPAAGTHVTIDKTCALDVNAGLLTFCAARGDVFAVLGTPAFAKDGLPFAEKHVLEHKTDLVTPFLARDDRRTPSFGALYHPWLVVTQEGAADAKPRMVAAAGTICGLIAARTLAHGAWFAPANRPLAGVVSTARAVDRTSWAALDRGHVNAVLLQPHGFVTLGAHTLTPDADFREISVRRLLILLRRLALREGPSLVFEPNGPDLTRAVRRQFERVLGDLFMRGALAGRRQGEAFQVVVDATNNPPQSVDLGRLIVELRVAPSRPLAFLIVRFMLRAGGTATVESA